MVKHFLSKYGVALILLLIIVAAYFIDISIKDIIETFRDLSILEIVLLTICSLVLMATDAFMRIFLLRKLGYNLSAQKVVLIHFSAMSAHYATPVKLGFPILAILLKKICNVSFSDSAIMISLGLLVSLGIAGLIAFVGSVLYYGENLGVIVSSLSIGLVLILISIPLLKKIKIRNKSIQNILEGFGKGLSKLKLQDFFIYSLLRIIAVILYGILFTMMVDFIGGDINIWESIVSTSSSFFLGAVSMVPMGLGVSEATLSFYLVSMGLNKGIIISVLILQRVFSTVVGFLAGIISSSVLSIRSIRLSSIHEE